MISIRFAERSDLVDIIECENSSLSYQDEETGTIQLRDWAKTKDCIKADIKNDEGNFRVAVCEVDEVVKASFLYSIENNVYEIKWLSIHKNAQKNDILEAIFNYFHNKIKKDMSKKIVINIRDRDEADFRDLYKFFKKKGFNFKLVPNFYPNGHDMWKGEYKL